MQPLAGMVVALLSITLLLAVAGCAGPGNEPATATPVENLTADPTGTPTGVASPPGSVTDAQMTKIDVALGTGPVFVEFGATWCSPCKLLKPIVAGLAGDCPGVTFVDIDVDSNRALADDFFVYAVPQMHIIVRKNGDGSYLYIDPGGNVTTDRLRSKIVGYHEYDELKPLIEAALAAR